MAQQRGAKVQILVGVETTFGQAPTEGFILPVNSVSVRPAQSVNQPGTLTGTRNPVQPFRGNKDVSGQITVPVDSRAFWYWFQFMFGAPVTVGAGPYVHEFKLGDTQPSFTIEEKMGDLTPTPQYVRYLGCKIANFALEVGGDGELTATIGIAGASFEVSASSFDASPTVVVLDRLGNTHAAINEGGSALAKGTKLSLSLDMGLDTNQYVIGGGGVRGAIPEGIVGVSGQLSTLFDGVDLLNKAISGTKSSLRLTLTKSAGSIFELEVQELEYAVNAPEVPGPQGLLVDLDFQGYYENASEVSAVVARLTNSDAHA